MTRKMNDDNYEYALFVVNRMNVGDDIQALAAKRFLPRVDHYIDRDRLDKVSEIHTQGNKNLKAIMNGWYLSGYEHWPPKNDKLKPLLTSIHVNPNEGSGAAIKAFQSKPSVEFLQQHGPVGARDQVTLKLLRDSGVDVYFSACLTLTLNPDKKVKKKDFILAVNVSDEVYAEMRRQTSRHIIRMDVEHTENTTTEENLELAQYYLYMYQSAHCVVTTRLHATLPTIAVGGKVLFIVESNGDNTDFQHRFSGLYELSNHATAAEFIEGGERVYDINNPPENPENYKVHRKELERICRDYTGFDSEKSYMFDKTIEDLVTNAWFFSAITRISEESWDAYKYEHKWSVPAIMYDDVHQSEPRQREIAHLRKQLYIEQNPGIMTSTRRFLKALAYKTGVRQRDETR